MRGKLSLFLGLLFLLLTACRDDPPADNSPIVVLTFDDEHESIYENALPMMEAHGFRGTAFVNTDELGIPGLLNWEQVHALADSSGWEIGGHTLNHQDLPHLTDEEVEQEVHLDYEALVAHGLPPVSFALPSGHATDRDFAIIERDYRIIRTSLDLSMRCPLDQQHLGYFFYSTDYNANNAISRVINGAANGEDLIVLGFHRVSDDYDGNPAICSIADFQKILDYLKNHGYRVLPLREAVDELEGK